MKALPGSPREPRMQGTFAGDPGQLTIVKPKRIGTTILAVVCIVAVLAILNAFRTGDIGWRYVSANLFAPSVMKGVVGTIVMTACAMALGIFLGVVAALMRMSENRVLQSTPSATSGCSGELRPCCSSCSGTISPSSSRRSACSGSFRSRPST